MNEKFTPEQMIQIEKIIDKRLKAMVNEASVSLRQYEEEDQKLTQELKKTVAAVEKIAAKIEENGKKNYGGITPEKAATLALLKTISHGWGPRGGYGRGPHGRGW